MASVIMHELAEVATDPELTAWVETGMEEVADVCEDRTAGIPQGVAFSNRGFYTLLGSGAYKFYVQAMLHRATQSCILGV